MITFLNICCKILDYFYNSIKAFVSHLSKVRLPELLITAGYSFIHANRFELSGNLVTSPTIWTRSSCVNFIRNLKVDEPNFTVGVRIIMPVFVLNLGLSFSSITCLEGTFRKWQIYIKTHREFSPRSTYGPSTKIFDFLNKRKNHKQL